MSFNDWWRKTWLYGFIDCLKFVFGKEKKCAHENKELVERAHCWNGYEGDVFKCRDCKRLVKIVSDIHWDGMTDSPGRGEMKLLLRGELIMEGAHFE